MRALWAPREVSDFEASARFYGEVLGLPRIQEWETASERGAVYSVGGSGRIEIVQAAQRYNPPGTAIELPNWADVDACAAKTGGVPRVFPRGHYGFVTADPDGHRLRRQWVASGFMVVHDPSRKTRSYRLSDDYERLVRA